MISLLEIFMNNKNGCDQLRHQSIDRYKIADFKRAFKNNMVEAISFSKSYEN